MEDVKPSASTCAGRLFANLNLSHRKYNEMPLLAQSRTLTSIHLKFVLLNRTVMGTCGFAINSETIMARWHPTNAPHALSNRNIPIPTARYANAGASHFMRPA